VTDAVFTTDRLVVRPWTTSQSDVDAAFDMYGDWEVARWLGSAPRPHTSREESAARLAEVVAREDPPGLGFWAAEHDGDVVGAILLRPLPGSTDVEVGWHLRRRCWGRGYATEGAQGALDHGFTTVGLSEVHAVVYPDNERSQAVCRRLGMTHVGRTDAWYGVEVDHYRLTRLS
jgi:RimJ/RimL family protein N-acetyltransferase